MEDLLTLIAELSVGIAGFTAVFTVLDPGRGEDARETALQLIRVKQMLLGGVVTAISCVVALGLLSSPLDRPTVWRVAGGLVTLALATLFVMLSAEARRERVASGPQYSRVHAAAIYALVGAAVVLLVATVVLAAEPIASVVFTAAMIAMFIVTATQFARAAIRHFGASRSRGRRPDGGP